MFSRILVKLIDQAITPAIALLATRIVSVIAVSRYLDIPFDIDQNGFTFTRADHYILVNSYSTFFMMLMLTLALLFILIKAFVFHESHITPKLSAQLFSLKLSSFVQASFDLYSQGAIWLSYTYLLVTITGLMALFGLVYTWVFYVGLILGVISTLLLVLDVENELVLKKGKSAEFDTDEIYLEENHEARS